MVKQLTATAPELDGQRSLVLLYCCGVLLNIAACGDGSKPQGPAAPETVIAQVDHLSGGVVGHDEGAEIEVPVGAFAGSVEVTVRAVEPKLVPLTAEENTRVGPTFEVEALMGGATVQPLAPVTLRLPYDKDLLPANVAENELVAVFWDGEAWVSVRSEVDEDESVVAARPGHFSMWSVESRGPNIAVTLAVLDASRLRAGDPVRIRIDARSPDDERAPDVDLLVSATYRDPDTGSTLLREGSLSLAEATDAADHRLDLFLDPSTLGDRIVTVYERDEQMGDGSFDLVVESDEVLDGVTAVAFRVHVGLGLSKLETDPVLVDFPLPLPPEADLAIRRLRLTDLEGKRLSGSGLEVGQEVLIDVDYANVGANPVLDARLELQLNGKQVAEASLLVATGSEGRHTFKFRLLEGRQSFQVVIGSAGLAVESNPADNRMHMEATTVAARHQLTGRLVEAGGAGLEGANLTLTGGGSLRVVTDSNGNFVFPGLANGQYTLFPSHAEHQIPPLRIEINGEDLAMAPIVVEQARYAISGKVVDNSGAPVAGLDIHLVGDAASATRTDAAGLYRFVNLLVGTYTVRPSDAGFDVSPEQVRVALAGAFSGVDFQVLGACPSNHTHA